MKIGNLEIRGDLVLAPMAGVTDLAFRTICAELGAAVTVTEMVSSRALIYQDKKSRSLLHRTPIGVCGAQIFGNDPQIMAQAAVLALELVNSAIERAVDKPDTTHWWSAGAAKDMAAGAVLVMAIGTVVVAVCLFWPRLDILWAAFTARPTRPLWLLLTLIVFYKFIFRSSNSTEKGKQPNGKTDS